MRKLLAPAIGPFSMPGQLYAHGAERRANAGFFYFGQTHSFKLKLLWEPRGKWPDEIVQSLCQELNLIHVVDPFLSRPVTKDLLYLRLHGGQRLQTHF